MVEKRENVNVKPSLTKSSKLRSCVKVEVAVRADIPVPHCPYSLSGRKSSCVITRFPTHDTEDKIALSNGLNESFGFQ